MNKKIIIILGLLALMPLFATIVSAQEPSRVKLTLHQAIEIAQTQSPDALIAKHRFKASYWEYRNFEAQFMPMLSFDGTLPQWSRSINKYTNADGTEVYVGQEFARYFGALSLSKTIGLTGGEVFVRSRLERVDNFSDSTRTSWLSSPVTIGLSQPLFSHNTYRWQKKIDPIKYEEAKRRYLEDNEQIAITTTNYFFNLLLSQIGLKIAQVNEASYDTLYRIAQGRYNMGTIGENELLQLELNLLRSRNEVQTSMLEVENNQFKLKSYLRLKGEENLTLIPPTEAWHGEVETAKAIEQALSNRSSAIAFDRRLLEARRDVSKARSDNRFSATLDVEYGLSQTASEVKDAYRNPQDQQQISLGLHVPILDWGLAKGRIKLAESNEELVKTSIEQERIDFEQEVFLSVMQFNMQPTQLKIAAKSDTVAGRSFQVAKARYMIGKISITDLNIAQNEKDQARRGFISSLQSYWLNYYSIRKLTLYDFKEKTTLLFNISKLL
ncbi:MAG: TolC family protein [Bacteroidales bacterium]|jgi:outer membrane protein TolC|nr:TolC family protein [Bacteroidales bacterium]MDD3665449.1 TolC family protein [Bacteroidales bacterium]